MPTKLYLDKGATKYDADISVDSWDEFVTETCRGNAICPCIIYEYSWYNPTLHEDPEDESHKLYLICRNWKYMGSLGLITVEITVTKKDEPEVKKFIKKNQVKVI